MVLMAIIMLIMTAPEKVITRMEPNVVTTTSKMHVWLNVESAGTKLVTPFSSPSCLLAHQCFQYRGYKPSSMPAEVVSFVIYRRSLHRK